MKSFTVSVALSLILMTPATLLAQDSAEEADILHPWLTDRFLINIGEFLPRKTIELSARGSAEQSNNTVIAFDETFKGGEKETTPGFNFHWRFGKNWWSSAEYYDTGFSEDTVLEKDILWNGVTFPAGSYARAGVGTDIYRLVLGRNLYRGDRSELGAGLGLHWLKLSAFIEGELLLGDESSGVRRESVSASAPLPNLTVWYLHSLSPKWAAFGRFDWLSASYKEYSGSIQNFNVGISYQAFKHLGLGLSYKRFQINVDVEDPDWYGAVKLTHRGPYLSLTANW